MNILGILKKYQIFIICLFVLVLISLYSFQLVGFSTDNLVFYYSFDSGSFNDYNFISGSLMGSPSYVEGVCGDALSFDGFDDYVYLGNSDNLSSNSMTVSFWLINKGTNKVSYIYDRGPDADTWGSLGIVYESGDLKVSSGRSVGQTAISYDSLSNNDFLAFVFDYPYCYVYQNSILVNTLTFENEFNLYSSDISTIGRAGEYSFYYFDGVLDEFLFYNRALSSQEISNIYNFPCLTSDLTCSDGNVTACLTSSDCYNNNFFWYNSSCHDSEPEYNVNNFYTSITNQNYAYGVTNVYNSLNATELTESMGVDFDFMQWLKDFLKSIGIEI